MKEQTNKGGKTKSRPNKSCIFLVPILNGTRFVPTSKISVLMLIKQMEVLFLSKALMFIANSMKICQI
jgi:hypothetical protein